MHFYVLFVQTGAHSPSQMEDLHNDDDDDDDDDNDDDDNMNVHFYVIFVQTGAHSPSQMEDLHWGSCSTEKRLCIVFVNQWDASGEKQDEERYGQLQELAYISFISMLNAWITIMTRYHRGFESHTANMIRVKYKINSCREEPVTNSSRIQLGSVFDDLYPQIGGSTWVRFDPKHD